MASRNLAMSHWPWGSLSVGEDDQLPDGIVEGADGEHLAKCSCCGEWTELYVGLEDIPAHGYQHYCGGSPRCCP